jgi:hypothetical protein
MTEKLSANESLRFIRGKLMPELGLVPLDSPTRTKGQAFAIGGESGRQFLLIMGNEAKGGAQQTRIIIEKLSSPPAIVGTRFSAEPARSARVNQQKTSLGHDNPFRNGNQSSFYVSNLDALAELVRWYASK